MASMDSTGKEQGSGIRVLLAMACVVVVFAGLKAATELFIPIMLGLFLAMLSLPILNWLDKRALPRPLAVLLTILVDLLIFGAIVFLTSGVIRDFQQEAPKYADRMRTQATAFTSSIDEQIARMEKMWMEAGQSIGVPGIEGEEAPEDQPVPQTDSEQDQATESDSVESPEKEGPALVGTRITFSKLMEPYTDTNRIMEFIGQFDIVGRFTSFATKSFFALIVMIFVLAESGSYAHKVTEVLKVRGPNLGRFQSITHDIQKYLGIKTVVSALTGILAMFSCMAFKVEFPLLWGLVAFLFNYVPAIGSIVAAIPPVILALILYGFWPGVGVLGCYLAINIGIGNFLEPMLLGERFGISTVIVILSVLFWGFIWGPVGMLLAVPLTMLVKVMLDNSSDLRWISALMGKGMKDAPPDDPPETNEDPKNAGDPEPAT
ncbi:MAG: AI-2E family transporter [Verrucomicrobiota bacterium]